MAKTLFVKSGADHDRVVLWERDDLHPDGEAFVAGKTPVEVGDTGTVARMLREGILCECDRDEVALAKRNQELVRMATAGVPAPVMSGPVLTVQEPTEMQDQVRKLMGEVQELREKLVARAEKEEGRK